jgi:hypothetical protein
MDQNVSEACNCSPIDLGMKGLQTIADPLSGFREGLEIAQNCVLNQLRPAKSFVTVLAIPIYAPDAIENVIE